jgi:RecG-like helicase
MKQEIFEYKSIQYIIEIGQNKQDNFDIINSADLKDIWFHVLKTYNKTNKIPHQVIKRCAYLCKINSKAKTELKCNIHYTTIDNVEHAEKKGQVHVKNFKTISV